MWFSGGADAAFVAASQRPDHYLNIPREWYAPIEQEAVILNRSERPRRAQRFLDWLTSPAARAFIAAAGYEVASND